LLPVKQYDIYGNADLINDMYVYGFETSGQKVLWLNKKFEFFSIKTVMHIDILNGLMSLITKDFN
jgi:hypothetical protein